MSLEKEGRDGAELRARSLVRDFHLVAIDQEIAIGAAVSKHNYHIPFADSLIDSTAKVKFPVTLMTRASQWALCSSPMHHRFLFSTRENLLRLGASALFGIEKMQSFITAEKEASICIRKGYRVQRDESVLVLADGNHELEAQALAAAANSAGAHVALMDISPIVAQGLLIPGIPEPPKHVSAAVKNSDVIIIKTEIDYAHRFAHTTTVREAVDNQVRIASVEEGLGGWGLTDEDIDKVERRTDRLIATFKGADKIHVTSKQGTDLTLSIKGRPPLKVTPVREKGVMMGPMPLWGEVAYAALEESANGQIVMDGVMNVVAPFGVKNYITVKAKNGRAYEITGGEEAQKLESVLSEADEGSNVVAEFSLGSGHLVKFGTLSEKGKLGTIHFALGDNHQAYPGGKNVSKWHLDATVRYPTVEVDGRIIIKDGQWTFDQEK